MERTWRWFGKKDKITLAQSKKVGDEETDVKKRPQARYVVLKRMISLERSFL